MESELAELSAHIEAATHRQLTLIRQLEPSVIWAVHGATSYAAWLGWRIGLAPGAAREKIRVARALGALPRIDAAFREARISYSKVRALTRVADEINEATLLDYALPTTAAHLEQICRGLRRVERDQDGQLQARDGTTERWLRVRAGEGGLARVEAQLHADEAALLMKALDVARASAGGDEVDALLAIARTFLTSARPDAERAGATRVGCELVIELRDGAPARMDEGAHVPAETLLRVACDASVRCVRTDASGSPLDAGRKTRVVARALRRALELRDDRRCRFPGCAHRVWLDAHHVEHWAHGGATALPNLVLLCPTHHRLVHEGGFTIELGDDGPRFRSAAGAIVPELPPPPPQPASIHAVRDVSAGTLVHTDSLLPQWDGRPPDVDACVAAARSTRPLSSGAAAAMQAARAGPGTIRS